LTDDFYVLGLGEIDVVLGIQWLQSLGRYAHDFQKMELEFIHDGKKVVLRALSDGGPRVVTRRMETLFRHNDVAWATQCFVSSKSSSRDQKYHVDIQSVLDKHSMEFREIPLGRPPDHGFEHVIELEEGSKPIITTPYRHPRHFTEEIEKMIKELLEMGRVDACFWTSQQLE